MSKPWEFDKDDADYEFRAGAMGGVFEPKLGTHVHKELFDAKVSLITIEHANARLNEWIAAAPVVWFNDDKTMSPYWECSSRQDKQHTHHAKLICIEPIVRDTAESLLRELIERSELKTSVHENPRYRLNTLIDRARKLLGEK